MSGERVAVAANQGRIEIDGAQLRRNDELTEKVPAISSEQLVRLRVLARELEREELAARIALFGEPIAVDGLQHRLDVGFELVVLVAHSSTSAAFSKRLRTL